MFQLHRHKIASTLLPTLFHHYSTPKIPTAAALMIADEILTGKVQDCNTYSLTKLFFDKGIQVREIRTIGDKEQDIVTHVLELSQKYDYVITSGGVGSTHDDITYASVAKAFNMELQYHRETIEKMKEVYAKRYEIKENTIEGSKQLKELLTSERLRMALLPNYCQVFFTPTLWTPLVQVHNVFIFPGIPELFERILLHHEHVFANGSKKIRYAILSDHFESEFSLAMRSLAKKYEPMQISIGSYPNFSKDMLGYEVIVTVEGYEEEIVDKASHELYKVIGGTKRIENEKEIQNLLEKRTKKIVSQWKSYKKVDTTDDADDSMHDM